MAQLALCRLLIQVKPKFHYADFATADTIHESPQHKSCRRLS